MLGDSAACERDFRPAGRDREILSAENLHVGYSLSVAATLIVCYLVWLAAR